MPKFVLEPEEINRVLSLHVANELLGTHLMPTGNGIAVIENDLLMGVELELQERPKRGPVPGAKKKAKKKTKRTTKKKAAK
jgi:hypothetical protein